ncbi:hypothetical protein [Burkholderia multivorans]|uniref:hypothetical protein n=1 Tax=Burkholderia multivorans TaxID=87883 RepID=UPI00158D5C97|nr:hypothetical protein [Burkholderia multivorans]MDN8102568.1 hypothetical protein [Burkholderia multivorans]
MNKRRPAAATLLLAVAPLLLMIWRTFIEDRPDWLVLSDLYFDGGLVGLALWYGGLALIARLGRELRETEESAS